MCAPAAAKFYTPPATVDHKVPKQVELQRKDYTFKNIYFSICISKICVPFKKSLHVCIICRIVEQSPDSLTTRKFSIEHHSNNTNPSPTYHEFTF